MYTECRQVNNILDIASCSSLNLVVHTYMRYIILYCHRNAVVIQHDILFQYNCIQTRIVQVHTTLYVYSSHKPCLHYMAIGVCVCVCVGGGGGGGMRSVHMGEG